MTHVGEEKKHQIFTFVFTFLTFAFLLAFYFFKINSGFQNTDEGVYLISSYMLLDYSPYSDVFMSQPPLFYFLVTFALFLFGSELIVARLVITFFSIFGLISLFLLINEFLKEKFTLIIRISIINVTIIFFGTLPSWYSLSNVIMPNIPQMSLTLFSFYCFIKALQSDHKLWYFIAGFFASLALLNKLLAGITILYYILLFIRRRFKRYNVTNDYFLIIGILIPLIPVLLWLIISPMMLFQTITYHTLKSSLIVSQYFLSYVFMNIGILVLWLISQGILIPFVFIGIKSILKSQDIIARNILIWTFFSIVCLLFFTPVFDHHFIIILPQLVIIAMIGILNLFENSQKFWKKIQNFDKLQLQILIGITLIFSCLLVLISIFLTNFLNYAIENSIILVLAFLVNYFSYLALILFIISIFILYFIYEQDLHIRKQAIKFLIVLILIFSFSFNVYASLNQKSYNNDEITFSTVSIINNHTKENDWIITDEQLDIFLAKKRVPPELVDTSFTRIYINDLTGDKLVNISEKYNVIMIILKTGRLSQIDSWKPYINSYFSLNYILDNSSNLWLSSNEFLNMNQEIFPVNGQIWMRKID